MEVKFRKNSEKWELHSGILRPFFPCSLPPVEGVLLFQLAPNTWLVPVWAPYLSAPLLSPALSEPKLHEGYHPYRLAWVKWEVQGSHGLLPGPRLIHEVLPSLFPGESQ